MSSLVDIGSRLKIVGSTFLALWLSRHRTFEPPTKSKLACQPAGWWLAGGWLVAGWWLAGRLASQLDGWLAAGLLADQ